MNIKWSMLAVSVALSFTAAAQDDVVRIVKTYEPTISDARKPDFRPNIDDTSSVQASFNYQVVPYQFTTGFHPDAIKPAKLLPEVVHPHYGSYVKLGFGSNISPLIDVRLNGKLKKDWYWGVTASHLSAFSPFTKNEKEYYPHIQENLLKVDARHYMKQFVFSASSALEIYGTPYYGFDFEDTAALAIPEDSLLRQRYILNENKFSLKSRSQVASRAKNNFLLEHYSLWDKFDTQEHEIALEWELEHEIKNNPIEVEAGLSYLAHRSLVDTSDNFLFELKPRFIREKEEWKFTLGLDFFTSINPERNAEFYINPNVEFEFAMAEDILHSYIGLDGGFEEGKLKNLAKENPFVQLQAPMPGTHTPLRVFAGFRGIFSENLKYYAEAAYKQVKSQPFYYSLMNASGAYIFDVVYDSADAFQARAEVLYAFNEKITAGINARYDLYFSLSNEAEAWLIPPYTASLFFKYNLQHKIEIGTDFQVLGKRNAKFVEGGGLVTSTVLPEAFDWNLDIEYRYNKKVSAFLQFENLLGNKYYLYTYYPTDGFRVYGGVIYSF